MRSHFVRLWQEADLALDSGNSFFCVGYGFNDDHIQPKLLEKCRQYNKNIVVLAKETYGCGEESFDGWWL